MDDLRRRFASLDAIPTPVDWADVERSADRATGSPVTRLGPTSVHQTLALSRGTVLAIVVGLLVIALVGIALVGTGLVPRPRFAVEPPEASPTARSTSSESSPNPSEFPASAVTPACPGVERPSELRITTVVLPDKRTGPFGRPVIAGCAVWITSGDNFGGIYRMALGTGEVTKVDPIEVVWDVDTDGASLYAIGRPGVTTGDEPGTLFEIDPRTGETLRQIPVPLKARQIRILDGRAWLSGRDMGVVNVDPETGAEVAILEPREQFGTTDIGTDAVWLVAYSPDGPGLTRIDRATQQTTTVPLPGDFTDVAVVGDRLFVSRASGHVSQIDPTTGAVITSVLVEALPQAPGTSFVGLAVQGTNLWALPVIQNATRNESTQIARIDGTTGQIVDRIAFKAIAPLDISATADDLWLFKADRSIVRFELPASN